MRNQAILVSVLFAVSTMFPIVASVANLDPVPLWIGFADVAIAAMLLTSALTLVMRSRASLDARAMAASLRFYRLTCNLALVLLVIFFVDASRIDWTILLVGLAWRFWLLWYVLPSLVSGFLANGTAVAAPSST